jgi:hypothetical protein
VLKSGLRRVIVGVTAAALALVVGCGEKAPKTGKITAIQPGSAACYDEQTDVGPRPQVAISYKPAGVDTFGKPWPTAFVCVTQDKAAKYKIGDIYP